MKGHGAKFDRKQEEAIAALLTQRNIEEAAEAVGIAANTLTALDEGARVPEGLPGSAPGSLQPIHRAAPAGNLGGRHHADQALIDPNTPASVKARAADSIFNHAAKAIEIEDIEARVAALEASVAMTREPAVDERGGDGGLAA